MIPRVIIIQILILIVVSIAFGTGVVTLSEAARPIVSILGLGYLGSVLFLDWKYFIQPRIHRFQFNQGQKQPVVQRQLANSPVFYDTTEPQFSWVAGLEEKAPAILDEIRAFLEKEGGVENEAFHTAYQNSVLSLSPTWKTLNLMSYGTVNSAQLPGTLEMISALPNIFTCNLSKLKAKSELRPHAGESTCYIRCHLGVEIPATAPTTAIHVGGQERSWEKGRVMAFCDGQWHGAHNHSDADRYVLIFDVMPERLGWYTKQFCALMVSLNVTQNLLPGRFNLDEPLWKPSIFLGYLSFTILGIPMVSSFYLYFRYFCRDRSPWIRRLSRAGFGFYY